MIVSTALLPTMIVSLILGPTSAQDFLAIIPWVRREGGRVRERGKEKVRTRRERIRKRGRVREIKEREIGREGELERGRGKDRV